VLGGVAAVLFCLQLVYLAAANLVLRSQLIQDAVGASEGFALEFSEAYSLWPGHVHLKDLSLRIEDYNVQFEVALGSAEVDIALTELPFKKFHATKLRAEGTRFRMRHKLITVGEDGERVAAFPPIKGFADPPYFKGVPAPESDTSSGNYDLWSVRIEDVVARVSELWVMEYRFQGRGVAAGSFVVMPERWVQVEPASLDLEGGTLTLGEHLVAKTLSGRMVCDIPDMRVPETEGVQVLRDVIATMKLDLRGGNLEFLRAYLARFGSARYGGDAEWHLDLNVARGVLQPGSKVELRASPLTVTHSFATLSGDTMLSFGRRDAAEQMALAVSVPRLSAQRAVKAPSPSVQGLSGSLAIVGVDFKQELSLGAAQLAIERAVAPSLAWFASEGTQLSGSAEASFKAARDEDAALTGRARVSLSDASYGRKDFGASGSVQGELGFSRAASADVVELHQATVELTQALLRSGEKRSKPFAARLDGSGIRVDPSSGANARGQLRLHVSSTEALLPLVVGGPLRGVASTALDLEDLNARATVQMSPGKLDVQVVDATSGNLRLKGYLSKREKQPRGAFLLSSGPLNVGVTLSDGETEVSPFVSDDWLASAWPRVNRVKTSG
jgi:hypothetical protein